jgi:hypothetical protein
MRLDDAALGAHREAAKANREEPAPDDRPDANGMIPVSNVKGIRALFQNISMRAAARTSAAPVSDDAAST